MNHEANSSMQFNASREIGTPEIRRQISKEFKSARESLELTIEQVSNTTKINQRFLNDIEDGRWSFLPPSYVKLFIRSFAEVVGINTDSFNSRLENLFRPIFKTQIIDSNEESSLTDGGSSTFSMWAERNRYIVIYSAIILIAIVTIVIYQMTGNDDLQVVSANDVNGILEAVPQDPISGTESEIQYDIITPESNEPEAIVIPVTKLEVLANDTCYVKIQHIDSVIYERTLWPGNTLSRELPLPLMLKMGNAPGLQVISNGDTLLSFPIGKRYRTLKITESD